MAEDKRLTDVRNEEYKALSDLEKTYGDRVAQADKYYDKLIQNSEAWADKQTELQNQQTDLAIEKIEQQREQAQKDYIKEQSAAYVDWQKQSDPYGVQAEQTATTGMTNTGYAETLQVSMYNTYQNRVATAREVIAQANMNFDNGIKEAKLQNSSILAEIHFNAYQEQLKLGLQSFQEQNQLLSELTDKKLQTKSLYQDKWKAVLNQINTENSLAEQQRQFDLNLEEQKRQHDETLAEQKRQFDLSRSGGSGVLDGGGSGSGDSGGSGSGSVIFDENGIPGTISTPYYIGRKNFDCDKYGTFSNGYQPKGISGHGKLTKSGETMQLTTEVKYGADKGKQLTLTQTVWKAEDGTLWYWEGRQNKYIQLGTVGGGGRKF